MTSLIILINMKKVRASKRVARHFCLYLLYNINK